MNETLEEECLAIRSSWGVRAAALKEEAMEAVILSLRGELRASVADLDAISRALAVGLGMVDAENYSLADKILGQIAAEVRHLQEETGKPGPLAAPLVLQGVAQARMGNLDASVASITYAKENPALPDSVWESAFVERYLEEEFEHWGTALLAGATKYPGWISDSTRHAEKALELSGEGRYAAIAAVRRVFQVAELHYNFPSEYTRMILLDAYRRLTVATEALAKKIGRANPKTLPFFEAEPHIAFYQALKILLGNSQFWTLAADRSAVSFDYRDPYGSLTSQARRIISNNRSSLDLFLAQVVAGACLVRNFAAHEVTFGTVVDDPEIHRAIGELTLTAFVYLPYMCARAGHIERFWDE